MLLMLQGVLGILRALRINSYSLSRNIFTLARWSEVLPKSCAGKENLRLSEGAKPWDPGQDH